MGVPPRSGRRGSDRSRHTQSTARPTRKPRAFPHRADLGKRPCPCSFQAAPHCLFQAHGFGSRPAEQGHPHVPTPHGFGQTSVPLFVSGRPALLVPSTVSGPAQPSRGTRAFPHRTDLGKRPCPCSFRAAPHCLFQARFRVAPSPAGAPARQASTLISGRRHSAQPLGERTHPFRWIDGYHRIVEDKITYRESGSCGLGLSATVVDGHIYDRCSTGPPARPQHW